VRPQKISSGVSIGVREKAQVIGVSGEELMAREQSCKAGEPGV